MYFIYSALASTVNEQTFLFKHNTTIYLSAKTPKTRKGRQKEKIRDTYDNTTAPISVTGVTG
jgi:hypothetical protein